MSIIKVVIPVAGMGTRLLPATKSQPKEMLPVATRPIVQYVVEEMIEGGLSKILFITGRKKRSIEDHFDFCPELGDRLDDESLYGSIARSDVDFFFIRQREARGLGDAISLGESFVDNESFGVALGDSIIRSGEHASLMRRLIQVQEENKASCTIAFEEVPAEDVGRYGIAKPKTPGTPVFEVEELIEKPEPGSAPSQLAIAARYIFGPEIFEALRRTAPGRRGELEITDAIANLIKMGHKVMGVKLRKDETRYDIGNFESYFKSFIDFALADEKYGYMVRQHIRNRLRDIE